MNYVKRLAVLVFLAATVARSQQSSVSPDSGEQHSIDQLRAVVELIKRCPPFKMENDPLAKDGFEDVFGPPTNVIWNVELHPSIRARYEGSIEFYEPSYIKLPPDDSYCNKPKINKSECRRMWVIGTDIYRGQANHPLQFRYEFDVTTHGVEFLRASKKTTQKEGEPWVEGDVNSDGCASAAIKSTLNNPNSVISPDRDMDFDTEKPPAGIPRNLWIAAHIGDEEAQSYLGGMYEEGKGVPQDYVEAYFWLDIAASGKQKTVSHEEIVKARDASASRITPEVLLQTQGRARKWFEEHPAKAEQP
jgi:hypothetical protein